MTTEDTITLLVDGVSRGSLYGLVALAIVFIYRSTGIVNFAQGEIATTATIACWVLAQHVPLLAAIAIALVGIAVLAALLDRAFFHRLDESTPFTPIIVTVGISMMLNSFALWYFGGTPQPMSSPWGEEVVTIREVAVSAHSVGTIVSVLAISIALVALFRLTPIGLAMRATAGNRLAARLMGIRTRLMITVGWSAAAVLSGIAGILIAPTAFVHPAMMQTVLVHSFIAAVVGGLNSPLGAVVGGVFVGVVENFAGDSEAIGDDLKTVFLVGLFVAVLVIRPRGLFGQRKARRV